MKFALWLDYYLKLAEKIALYLSNISHRQVQRKLQMFIISLGKQQNSAMDLISYRCFSMVIGTFHSSIWKLLLSKNDFSARKRYSSLSTISWSFKTPLYPKKVQFSSKFSILWLIAHLIERSLRYPTHYYLFNL